MLLIRVDGWFGWMDDRGGWLTSLPIVLRPKPATARLVDIVDPNG